MDEEEHRRHIDDQRVLGYEPLIPPAFLKHEILPSPESQTTVAHGRYVAASIISGRDDRVLVIVGPCSIVRVTLDLLHQDIYKKKLPPSTTPHRPWNTPDF